MKKINVGIIGCGVISYDHIRAYSLLPDVNVKTLCDLDASKAAQLGNEFNIKDIRSEAASVFADNEIDAVSICTDHFSHAALSVAALDAGKHVLCEKPLSSSKQNMDSMLTAESHHPELVFACVFQHRFNPVYAYVKKMMEQGGFGRLLSCTLSMFCMRTKEYYESALWRGKWHTEGGSVTMNQAIHSIDIFQWIAGGADAVKGMYANLEHKGIIETEDTAAACIRFKNGALGTIATSSASHLNWKIGMTFYGTTATMELRDASLYSFTAENAELEKRVIDELNAIGEAEAANHAKSYYGIGHPPVIADFIGAIREKRKPFVTPSMAREAVDISQKILGRE